MVSKLARKLFENGIVPGPALVHTSTYPLFTGGVLQPKLKKEAVSGSAHPEVLRKKESIQESAQSQPQKMIEIRSRFREAEETPAVGNKFKVILIQEGLGNFKSAFYYTKECLQQAAALFEGKKCFADHPSAIEEQVRPERSTRDILGYFESVEYVEKNGRGWLEAQLCLEETASIDWARSLLTNSLEYAKKYTDKDFVGLSINASGEAHPVQLDEFMKSGLPESVIPKLLEAKELGIDQIQVVNSLKDAISCDLVTEAGAGGKILSMIESQRGKTMKVKENEKKQAGPAIPKNPGKTGPLPVKDKKENEEMAAPAKDGDGHQDEEQDKALFAKMIKQFLGEEHEHDEEAMKMAKHAYEAHKEEGMESEAAYEAAGKHLKMAMAIGKKMSQGEEHQAEAEEKKEEAPKEEECHEDEAKQAEKKEAAASFCKGCVEKAAQISKLKESLSSIELGQYLEKKCQESKLPMKITKEARTIIGKPKSKEQINQVIETFIRVHKSTVEDAAQDSWFMPEKTQFVESEGKNKIGSFADCKNS